MSAMCLPHVYLVTASCVSCDCIGDHRSSVPYDVDLYALRWDLTCILSSPWTQVEYVRRAFMSTKQRLFVEDVHILHTLNMHSIYLGLGRTSNIFDLRTIGFNQAHCSSIYSRHSYQGHCSEVPESYSLQ
jgi:hypothetical protein